MFACSGPSEDDCKTCTDGFMFDEKQKKCSSLCPNGNYYNKNDSVSISEFDITKEVVFVL
jgi:hypothetical protein